MSYTGQEIYNMSIAVIDEMSDNGTVSNTETKDYYNRAPYLLDMWYGEEDIFDVQEYTFSDKEQINTIIKCDLPTDFGTVIDTIFVDADSNISSIDYRQFGDTEIYVLLKTLGTLKLRYKAMPEKITSLTQALKVDVIRARKGAYYLAEQFFRADMNDNAADRCYSKYKTLENKDLKEPPTSQFIIDVYGW